MWLSAVGVAVGGGDTTHRTAKPNKPAPKAALAAPQAPKLVCQLRGEPGKRWCSVCRWAERRSECPGTIDSAVIDCNAELRSRGKLAHHVVKLTPLLDSQLVKDMPRLACLVCGATGAARASSFASPCGQPSKAGKAALSRLAGRLAPGAAKVSVDLELLHGC